jgi:hypothetical protein
LVGAGVEQFAEKVRTKGELAMVDFAGAKAQVCFFALAAVRAEALTYQSCPVTKPC